MHVRQALPKQKPKKVKHGSSFNAMLDIQDTINGKQFIFTVFTFWSLGLVIIFII